MSTHPEILFPYRRPLVAAIIFLYFVLSLLISFSVREHMLKWGSFMVPIDNKYSLVKVDSVDIFLSYRSSGSKYAIPVVMPGDYPGLGPISALAFTETYIFSEHYGKKKRNLFEGDELAVADETKKYWMLTNRINNDILGPLSYRQFSEWVAALQIKMPVKWNTTEEIYRESIQNFPQQVETNRLLGKQLIMGPVNGLLTFVIFLIPVSLLLLLYYHYGAICEASFFRWSLLAPAIPATLIATVTVISTSSI